MLFWTPVRRRSAPTCWSRPVSWPTRVAHAFGDRGDAEELEAIARSLSFGELDREMHRAHARKLAAALKRLANDPWTN
jgi:hypothetical protein